jgi:hypothetical protein
MTRVVIESPFGGTDDEVRRNIKYARACVADSLEKGEAPYASHLFFTQPGILDDNLPEERMLGINAGLEITKDFDLTAVYCDFGKSKGMLYGIEKAKTLGRKIEERYLGENWEESYNKRMGQHSHNGFFN